MLHVIFHIHLKLDHGNIEDVQYCLKQYCIGKKGGWNAEVLRDGTRVQSFR